MSQHATSKVSSERHKIVRQSSEDIKRELSFVWKIRVSVTKHLFCLSNSGELPKFRSLLCHGSAEQSHHRIISSAQLQRAETYKFPLSWQALLGYSAWSEAVSVKSGVGRESSIWQVPQGLPSHPHLFTPGNAGGIPRAPQKTLWFRGWFNVFLPSKLCRLSVSLQPLKSGLLGRSQRRGRAVH